MKLFIVASAVIVFCGLIVGVWYLTVLKKSAPGNQTIELSKQSNPTNTYSNVSSNASVSTENNVSYAAPVGWVRDTTNKQSDDVILLNRPDSAAGISESEMLNANEGFIRITPITRTNDDFLQLNQLLTGGASLNSNSTAEDPYESQVVSQDNIELLALRGRVYTHTNAVSGQLLDTRITGVLQDSNGGLIYIKAGYGRGTDSEQLREEIFSIIRSLSN